MDIKHLLITALPVLAIALSSQTAFAEIYRWVDENGQTRFSDRPVKGANAKTIKVDASKNSYGGGDVLNRQRDLLDRYDKQDIAQKKAKQVAAQEKADEAQLKRNCIKAKDKLASYERSKLYDLDENGERVYYSEERRSKAIESLRQAIRKSCI